MITVGLGDVGLEQVALDEGRELGDAGLLGVLARQRDHVRIEFDADGGGAALGRGDDGAAVARAEIHHGTRPASTLAMSSMRSTSACGVGTHTTSLPGWPTRGSNFSASAAPATMTTARHESASDRVKDCDNLINVSNECVTPCVAPRGTAARAGH